MELSDMTALALAEKIKKNEITPTDAVKSVAAAFQKYDGAYNCYTSFDVESALAQAAEVEKRLQGGDTLSALAGVPIAVKDNICERGVAATCASKMLQNFVSPYDATVIAKLKNAGMIPLGRTNMDEFAMGWSTEKSVFGATKNPWNAARVAGGSSGGSAAAVAAGESVIALGSDTGGSIRQPASFCGVTGFKPTYGAVSRYGLISFASSLDVIGTLSQTAADAAALFAIISGADSRDMTSHDTPPSKRNDLSDVRIGVPVEFFSDCEPAVATLVQNSRAVFEDLGAACTEFSLPLIQYALAAYHVIACAEASSNLARYDGVKYGHRASADNLEEMYIRSRSEGFGTEVKKRIMLGNFVLSAGYYDDYYNKALKVKNLICSAFETAFEKFDYILTPTVPCTAFQTGERAGNIYLGDRYTAIANIAGLPALSLPCGFDSAGMPVGMQLIGRARDDGGVLSLGALYQSVTDFHTVTPKKEVAE